MHILDRHSGDWVSCDSKSVLEHTYPSLIVKGYIAREESIRWTFSRLAAPILWSLWSMHCSKLAVAWLVTAAHITRWPSTSGQLYHSMLHINETCSSHQNGKSQRHSKVFQAFHALTAGFCWVSGRMLSGSRDSEGLTYRYLVLHWRNAWSI